MARVRGLLTICLLLGACALLASGCGETKTASAAPVAVPKPRCAHPAGWQKLANRIKAPVYCPGWLPDPLTSQIDGKWSNGNSVSPDRSYLESFVWQETGPGAAGGELHVNLRGYPATTKVPTCEDTILGSGKKVRRVKIPCFSDAQPSQTIGGFRVTEYRVNQGADQWHVLYAWKDKDSLYTVSEHVAPPVTYSKAKLYLAKILRNLVRIQPARY